MSVPHGGPRREPTGRAVVLSTRAAARVAAVAVADWLRLGRRLTIRCLVALALLALALGPTTTPVALAHAELVRTDPADGAVLSASPNGIKLTFNEPIEREFFAVEVFNDRRARVDRRDARVASGDPRSLEAGVQELGPGIYTVIWRALSIDGHVVRGAFAFSVGVDAPVAGTATLLASFENGTPFALGAVARWWTFLAAFALVGGLAFGPLVLWPALSAAPQEGQATARADRLFAWVAWPAAVLLVLLTLLTLLLQAADVTGQTLGEVLGGRAVTRLLTGTKYGALWITRFGLVLVMLGALAATSVIPGRAPRAGWSRWTGAALGAGLLLSLSATGHASAVPGQAPLAIVADWAHLLAAALWVGGLLQLAVVLPPVLLALDAPARRAVLARTMRRFSTVAGTSVVALFVTGVYAGVVHVPSWAALLDTAYGAALSGKLLLVAPLLAIGAVNLFVLHPRFVRSTRDIAARATSGSPGARTLGAGEPGRGAADDAFGRRVFRWLAAGEVILAALVLWVTGILTGLPPASSFDLLAEPVRETQRVGDLEISLWVDPNRAGPNSYKVQVTDGRGVPVAGARVVLDLGHQEMDMGQREVLAQPVGAGRYEAGGSQLSMSGRWLAAVVVRRPGADDVRAEFPVAVGQPAGANRTLFSPGRILLYSLTPQLLLGIVGMALAAVAFAMRHRRPRRAGRPLAATGAALALTGLLASVTAVAGGYRESVASAMPVVNPIAPTAESLALGGQLYAQNCLVCHGATGRGDGPAGRALRPPPADFRVHMAAGHTDEQLFEWISKGVVGTAMQAFADRLTADERWHLVNYIRTFADPGTPSAP